MLISSARTIAALLASSAILAGSSIASASETTLTNALASGSTIEIRAIDGSIDVSHGTGPVKVVARLTPGPGKAIDMHVVEQRSSNSWIVCAVPLEQTSCDDPVSHYNDPTRVDFAISLPDGVNVRARDVSGNVRIRGVASDIDAQSVSGDVRVATRGSAKAKTISGNLDVALGRVTRDVSFASVSGDVHVAIPRSANASINAKTVSGDVSGTGVSFTGNSEFVGHNVSAILGNGATAVDIKTISGSIYVKTL